jgi:hypothetical protein
MLTGKPPFPPCTENGDGGGHGSIVKDEVGSRKDDVRLGKMKEERKCLNGVKSFYGY